MSWMKKTIALSTFAFINLILFIIFSNPFGTILGKIDEEASKIDDTNVPSFSYNSKVVPFLNNLATLFGLMFLFSFVGLILWFLLSSHEEEYETYPGQDNFFRGGF